MLTRVEPTGTIPEYTAKKIKYRSDPSSYDAKTTQVPKAQYLS